ncbi:MAG: hypothetical protein K0S53_454 [Bacteroidetes bacterium]|jgi:hypothetical protein|nr:hypothetical protein [Bacteroidota bacterium]MDF2452872.1 hypothetical protein [Bacteroidota bacterium]
MKNYTFLLKPAFFLFNLIFATWLVFKIEEISPSDFGKYKSLFEDPPGSIGYKKKHLKKIIIDFKAGKLDSLQLERQLEIYLESGGNSN